MYREGEGVSNTVYDVVENFPLSKRENSNLMVRAILYVYNLCSY